MHSKSWKLGNLLSTKNWWRMRVLQKRQLNGCILIWHRFYKSSVRNSIILIWNGQPFPRKSVSRNGRWGYYNTTGKSMEIRNEEVRRIAINFLPHQIYVRYEWPQLFIQFSLFLLSFFPISNSPVFYQIADKRAAKSMQEVQQAIQQ